MRSPEKLLQSESVNLSMNMRKETVHKLQESSRKPKKIFCLNRAYLATMNLKFFKELSGGLLLFILVLELAMSQENLNGAIFILSEIQKPTIKFLFGMQKEAPKHAMATVNIDEHLIPPLKQQIQIVVLSNYSRNMRPIGQPK